MGGNTLRNVAEPVKQNDVATKDYADYIKLSSEGYINYKHVELLKYIDSLEILDITKVIKKNIIMVSGSYTGPLRREQFQFSFGGNNNNLGFMIPHSGRIKKIKMKTPINRASFEHEAAHGRLTLSEYTNTPFFTFTKAKEETYHSYNIIGAIQCLSAYKRELRPGRTVFVEYDFCFDDYLPLDLDGSELEEGDIINIRTEIDLDFRPYSE